MSTKASFSYSSEFHFYDDLMDDGGVFLSMEGEGVEFEARARGVTVRIPKHIWAVIREQAPVDLSLAEVSDEDLLVRIEAEVDERLAKYNAASAREKPLLSFFGAALYGSAEESRADQIQNALANYRAERARQLELLTKIRAIQNRHED